MSSAFRLLKKTRTALLAEKIISHLRSDGGSCLEPSVTQPNIIAAARSAAEVSRPAEQHWCLRLRRAADLLAQPLHHPAAVLLAAYWRLPRPELLVLRAAHSN
jgi:hypothetical protein